MNLQESFESPLSNERSICLSRYENISSNDRNFDSEYIDLLRKYETFFAHSATKESLFTVQMSRKDIQKAGNETYERLEVRIDIHTEPSELTQEERDKIYVLFHLLKDAGFQISHFGSLLSDLSGLDSATKCDMGICGVKSDFYSQIRSFRMSIDDMHKNTEEHWTPYHNRSILLDRLFNLVMWNLEISLVRLEQVSPEVKNRVLSILAGNIDDYKLILRNQKNEFARIFGDIAKITDQKELREKIRAFLDTFSRETLMQWVKFHVLNMFQSSRGGSRFSPEVMNGQAWKKEDTYYHTEMLRIFPGRIYHGQVIKSIDSQQGMPIYVEFGNIRYVGVSFMNNEHVFLSLDGKYSLLQTTDGRNICEVNSEIPSVSIYGKIYRLCRVINHSNKASVWAYVSDDAEGSMLSTPELWQTSHISQKDEVNIEGKLYMQIQSSKYPAGIYVERDTLMPFQIGDRYVQKCSRITEMDVPGRTIYQIYFPQKNNWNYYSCIWGDFDHLRDDEGVSVSELSLKEGITVFDSQKYIRWTVQNRAHPVYLSTDSVSILRIDGEIITALGNAVSIAGKTYRQVTWVSSGVYYFSENTKEVLKRKTGQIIKEISPSEVGGYMKLTDTDGASCYVSNMTEELRSSDGRVVENILWLSTFGNQKFLHVQFQWETTRFYIDTTSYHILETEDGIAINAIASDTYYYRPFIFCGKKHFAVVCSDELSYISLDTRKILTTKEGHKILDALPGIKIGDITYTPIKISNIHCSDYHLLTTEGSILSVDSSPVSLYQGRLPGYMHTIWWENYIAMSIGTESCYMTLSSPYRLLKDPKWMPIREYRSQKIGEIEYALVNKTSIVSPDNLSAHMYISTHDGQKKIQALSEKSGKVFFNLVGEKDERCLPMDQFLSKISFQEI